VNHCWCFLINCKTLSFFLLSVLVLTKKFRAARKFLTFPINFLTVRPNNSRSLRIRIVYRTQARNHPILRSCTSKEFAGCWLLIFISSSSFQVKILATVKRWESLKQVKFSWLHLPDRVVYVENTQILLVTAVFKGMTASSNSTAVLWVRSLGYILGVCIAACRPVNATRRVKTTDWRYELRDLSISMILCSLLGPRSAYLIKYLHHPYHNSTSPNGSPQNCGLRHKHKFHPICIKLKK